MVEPSGRGLVPWWQGVLSVLHPLLLWQWLIGPHSWLYKVYRNIKSGFDPRYRRRRRLLSWVGEATGRDVPDLYTVWRDGSVICDIIHHSCPSSTSDHEGWDDCRETFSHAQALAYRCLSLQPAFSEAELSRVELTPTKEKRLFRYLQSLKAAVSKRQIDRSVDDDSDSEAHIAVEYIARGMGLIMGSRKQRAIFYVYSRDGSSLMDIHIEIRGPGDDFGSILITNSEGYNQRECSIAMEYRLTDEYLRVSYQPRSVGHHELTISRFGYIIPGSPFLVSVDEISETLPKKRFNSIEWYSEDEEKRQKKINEKKKNAKVKYRIVDFITEKMYLTEDGTLLKIPQASSPTDSQTPPPPLSPTPEINLSPAIGISPSPSPSYDSSGSSRSRRSISPRIKKKRLDRTKWTDVRSDAMKYVILKNQKAEVKKMSDAAAQVTLLYQHNLFQEKCKRIVTVCDYLLQHSPRQKSLEIISGAGQILQSEEQGAVINKNHTIKEASNYESDFDDEVFIPSPTVRTITYPERCRSVSLSFVNDEAQYSNNVDDKLDKGICNTRVSSEDAASVARASYRVEGNTKSPRRRTSFSSINPSNDNNEKTEEYANNEFLKVDESSIILYNNNSFVVTNSQLISNTEIDKQPQVSNLKCNKEEKSESMNNLIDKSTNIGSQYEQMSKSDVVRDYRTNIMLTDESVVNMIGGGEKVTKKSSDSQKNLVGKIIQNFENGIIENVEKYRKENVSNEFELANVICSSTAKTLNKDDWFCDDSERLRVEYLKSLGGTTESFSTIKSKINIFENKIIDNIPEDKTDNSKQFQANDNNKKYIFSINNNKSAIESHTREDHVFRAEPALVVSKHYAELHEIAHNTKNKPDGIFFEFKTKDNYTEEHELDKNLYQEDFNLQLGRRMKTLDDSRSNEQEYSSNAISIRSGRENPSVVAQEGLNSNDTTSDNVATGLERSNISNMDKKCNSIVCTVVNNEDEITSLQHKQSKDLEVSYINKNDKIEGATDVDIDLKLTILQQEGRQNEEVTISKEKRSSLLKQTETNNPVSLQVSNTSSVIKNENLLSDYPHPKNTVNTIDCSRTLNQEDLHCNLAEDIVFKTNLKQQVEDKTLAVPYYKQEHDLIDNPKLEIHVRSLSIFKEGFQSLSISNENKKGEVLCHKTSDKNTVKRIKNSTICNQNESMINAENNKNIETIIDLQEKTEKVKSENHREKDYLFGTEDKYDVDFRKEPQERMQNLDCSTNSKETPTQENLLSDCLSPIILNKTDVKPDILVSNPLVDNNSEAFKITDETEIHTSPPSKNKTPDGLLSYKAENNENSTNMQNQDCLIINTKIATNLEKKLIDDLGQINILPSSNDKTPANPIIVKEVDNDAENNSIQCDKKQHLDILTNNTKKDKNVETTIIVQEQINYLLSNTGVNIDNNGKQHEKMQRLHIVINNTEIEKNLEANLIKQEKINPSLLSYDMAPDNLLSYTGVDNDVDTNSVKIEEMKKQDNFINNTEIDNNLQANIIKEEEQNLLEPLKYKSSGDLLRDAAEKNVVENNSIQHKEKRNVGVNNTEIDTNVHVNLNGQEAINKLPQSNDNTQDDLLRDTATDNDVGKNSLENGGIQKFDVLIKNTKILRNLNTNIIEQEEMHTLAPSTDKTTDDLLTDTAVDNDVGKSTVENEEIHDIDILINNTDISRKLEPNTIEHEEINTLAASNDKTPDDLLTNTAVDNDVGKSSLQNEEIQNIDVLINNTEILTYVETNIIQQEEINTFSPATDKTANDILRDTAVDYDVEKSSVENDEIQNKDNLMNNTEMDDNLEANIIDQKPINALLSSYNKTADDLLNDTEVVNDIGNKSTEHEEMQELGVLIINTEIDNILETDLTDQEKINTLKLSNNKAADDLLSDTEVDNDVGNKSTEHEEMQDLGILIHNTEKKNYKEGNHINKEQINTLLSSYYVTLDDVLKDTGVDNDFRYSKIQNENIQNLDIAIDNIAIVTKLETNRIDQEEINALELPKEKISDDLLSDTRIDNDVTNNKIQQEIPNQDHLISNTKLDNNLEANIIEQEEPILLESLTDKSSNDLLSGISEDNDVAKNKVQNEEIPKHDLIAKTKVNNDLKANIIEQEEQILLQPLKDKSSVDLLSYLREDNDAENNFEQNEEILNHLMAHTEVHNTLEAIIIEQEEQHLLESSTDKSSNDLLSDIREDNYVGYKSIEKEEIQNNDHLITNTKIDTNLEANIIEHKRVDNDVRKNSKEHEKIQDIDVLNISTDISRNLETNTIEHEEIHTLAPSNDETPDNLLTDTAVDNNVEKSRVEDEKIQDIDVLNISTDISRNLETNTIEQEEIHTLAPSNDETPDNLLTDTAVDNDVGKSSIEDEKIQDIDVLNISTDISRNLETNTIEQEEMHTLALSNDNTPDNLITDTAVDNDVGKSSIEDEKIQDIDVLNISTDISRNLETNTIEQEEMHTLAPSNDNTPDNLITDTAVDNYVGKSSVEDEKIQDIDVLNISTDISRNLETNTIEQEEIYTLAPSTVKTTDDLLTDTAVDNDVGKSSVENDEIQDIDVLNISTDISGNLETNTIEQEEIHTLAPSTVKTIDDLLTDTAVDNDVGKSTEENKKIQDIGVLNKNTEIPQNVETNIMEQEDINTFAPSNDKTPDHLITDTPVDNDIGKGSVEHEKIQDIDVLNISTDISRNLQTSTIEQEEIHTLATSTVKTTDDLLTDTAVDNEVGKSSVENEEIQDIDVLNISADISRNLETNTIEQEEIHTLAPSNDETPDNLLTDTAVDNDVGKSSIEDEKIQDIDVLNISTDISRNLETNTIEQEEMHTLALSNDNTPDNLITDTAVDNDVGKSSIEDEKIQDIDVLNISTDISRNLETNTIEQEEMHTLAPSNDNTPDNLITDTAVDNYVGKSSVEDEKIQDIDVLNISTDISRNLETNTIEQEEIYTLAPSTVKTTDDLLTDTAVDNDVGKSSVENDEIQDIDVLNISTDISGNLETNTIEQEEIHTLAPSTVKTIDDLLTDTAVDNDVGKSTEENKKIQDIGVLNKNTEIPQNVETNIMEQEDINTFAPSNDKTPDHLITDTPVDNDIGKGSVEHEKIQDIDVLNISTDISRNLQTSTIEQEEIHTLATSTVKTTDDLLTDTAVDNEVGKSSVENEEIQGIDVLNISADISRNLETNTIEQEEIHTFATSTVKTTDDLLTDTAVDNDVGKSSVENEEIQDIDVLNISADISRNLETNTIEQEEIHTFATSTVKTTYDLLTDTAVDNDVLKSSVENEEIQDIDVLNISTDISRNLGTNTIEQEEIHTLTPSTVKTTDDLLTDTAVDNEVGKSSVENGELQDIDVLNISTDISRNLETNTIEQEEMHTLAPLTVKTTDDFLTDTAVDNDVGKSSVENEEIQDIDVLNISTDISRNLETNTIEQEEIHTLAPSTVKTSDDLLTDTAVDNAVGKSSVENEEIQDSDVLVNNIEITRHLETNIMEQEDINTFAPSTVKTTDDLLTDTPVDNDVGKINVEDEKIQDIDVLNISIDISRNLETNIIEQEEIYTLAPSTVKTTDDFLTDTAVDNDVGKSSVEHEKIQDIDVLNISTDISRNLLTSTIEQDEIHTLAKSTVKTTDDLLTDTAVDNDVGKSSVEHEKIQDIDVLNIFTDISRNLETNTIEQEEIHTLSPSTVKTTDDLLTDTAVDNDVGKSSVENEEIQDSDLLVYSIEITRNLETNIMEQEDINTFAPSNDKTPDDLITDTPVDNDVVKSSVENEQIQDIDVLNISTDISRNLETNTIEQEEIHTLAPSTVKTTDDLLTDTAVDNDVGKSTVENKELHDIDVLIKNTKIPQNLENNIMEQEDINTFAPSNDKTPDHLITDTPVDNDIGKGSVEHEKIQDIDVLNISTDISRNLQTSTIEQEEIHTLATSTVKTTDDLLTDTAVDNEVGKSSVENEEIQDIDVLNISADISRNLETNTIEQEEIHTLAPSNDETPDNLLTDTAVDNDVGKSSIEDEKIQDIDVLNISTDISRNLETNTIEQEEMHTLALSNDNTPDNLITDTAVDNDVGKSSIEDEKIQDIDVLNISTDISRNLETNTIEQEEMHTLAPSNDNTPDNLITDTAVDNYVGKSSVEDEKIQDIDVLNISTDISRNLETNTIEQEEIYTLAPSTVKTTDDLLTDTAVDNDVGKSSVENDEIQDIDVLNISTDISGNLETNTIEQEEIHTLAPSTVKTIDDLLTDTAVDNDVGKSTEENKKIQDIGVLNKNTEIPQNVETNIMEQEDINTFAPSNDKTPDHLITDTPVDNDIGKGSVEHEKIQDIDVLNISTDISRNLQTSTIEQEEIHTLATSTVKTTDDLLTDTAVDNEVGKSSVENEEIQGIDVLNISADISRNLETNTIEQEEIHTFATSTVKTTDDLLTDTAVDNDVGKSSVENEEIQDIDVLNISADISRNLETNTIEQEEIHTFATSTVKTTYDLLTDTAVDNDVLKSSVENEEIQDIDVLNISTDISRNLGTNTIEQEEIHTLTPSTVKTTDDLLTDTAVDNEVGKSSVENGELQDIDVLNISTDISRNLETNTIEQEEMHTLAPLTVKTTDDFLTDTAVDNDVGKSSVENEEIQDIDVLNISTDISRNLETNTIEQEEIHTLAPSTVKTSDDLLTDTAVDNAVGKSSVENEEIQDSDVLVNNIEITRHLETNIMEQEDINTFAPSTVKTTDDLLTDTPVDNDVGKINVEDEKIQDIDVLNISIDISRNLETNIIEQEEIYTLAPSTVKTTDDFLTDTAVDNDVGKSSVEHEKIQDIDVLNISTDISRNLLTSTIEQDEIHTLAKSTVKTTDDLLTDTAVDNDVGKSSVEHEKIQDIDVLNIFTDISRNLETNTIEQEEIHTLSPSTVKTTDDLLTDTAVDNDVGKSSVENEEIQDSDLLVYSIEITRNLETNIMEQEDINTFAPSNDKTPDDLITDTPVDNDVVKSSVENEQIQDIDVLNISTDISRNLETNTIEQEEIHTLAPSTVKTTDDLLTDTAVDNDVGKSTVENKELHDIDVLIKNTKIPQNLENNIMEQEDINTFAPSNDKTPDNLLTDTAVDNDVGKSSVEREKIQDIDVLNISTGISRNLETNTIEQEEIHTLATLTVKTTDDLLTDTEVDNDVGKRGVEDIQDIDVLNISADISRNLETNTIEQEEIHTFATSTVKTTDDLLTDTAVDNDVGNSSVENEEMQDIAVLNISADISRNLETNTIEQEEIHTLAPSTVKTTDDLLTDTEVDNDVGKSSVENDEIQDINVLNISADISRNLETNTIEQEEIHTFATSTVKTTDDLLTDTAVDNDVGKSSVENEEMQDIAVLNISADISRNLETNTIEQEEIHTLAPSTVKTSDDLLTDTAVDNDVGKSSVENEEIQDIDVLNISTGISRNLETNTIEQEEIHTFATSTVKTTYDLLTDTAVDNDVGKSSIEHEKIQDIDVLNISTDISRNLLTSTIEQDEIHTLATSTVKTTDDLLTDTAVDNDVGKSSVENEEIQDIDVLNIFTDISRNLETNTIEQEEIHTLSPSTVKTTDDLLTDTAVDNDVGKSSVENEEIQDIDVLNISADISQNLETNTIEQEKIHNLARSTVKTTDDLLTDTAVDNDVGKSSVENEEIQDSDVLVNNIEITRNLETNIMEQEDINTFAPSNDKTPDDLITDTPVDNDVGKSSVEHEEIQDIDILINNTEISQKLETHIIEHEEINTLATLNDQTPDDLHTDTAIDNDVGKSSVEHEEIQDIDVLFNNTEISQKLETHIIEHEEINTLATLNDQTPDDLHTDTTIDNDVGKSSVEHEEIQDIDVLINNTEISQKLETHIIEHEEINTLATLNDQTPDDLHTDTAIDNDVGKSSVEHEEIQDIDVLINNTEISRKLETNTIEYEETNTLATSNDQTLDNLLSDSAVENIVGKSSVEHKEIQDIDVLNISTDIFNLEIITVEHEEINILALSNDNTPDDLITDTPVDNDVGKRIVKHEKIQEFDVLINVTEISQNLETNTIEYEEINTKDQTTSTSNGKTTDDLITETPVDNDVGKSSFEHEEIQDFDVLIYNTEISQNLENNTLEQKEINTLATSNDQTPYYLLTDTAVDNDAGTNSVENEEIQDIDILINITEISKKLESKIIEQEETSALVLSNYKTPDVLLIDTGVDNDVGNSVIQHKKIQNQDITIKNIELNKDLETNLIDQEQINKLALPNDKTSDDLINDGTLVTNEKQDLIIAFDNKDDKVDHYLQNVVAVEVENNDYTSFQEYFFCKNKPNILAVTNTSVEKKENHITNVQDVFTCNNNIDISEKMKIITIPTQENCSLNNEFSNKTLSDYHLDEVQKKENSSIEKEDEKICKYVESFTTFDKQNNEPFLCSSHTEPAILSSSFINKRIEKSGNAPSHLQLLRQRFEKEHDDFTLGNISHYKVTIQENYNEHQKLIIDSETLNSNLLNLEQELSDVLSIEDEEIDQNICKEIDSIDSMEPPELQISDIFAFKNKSELDVKERYLETVNTFPNLENETIDQSIQEEICEVELIPDSEINKNEFFKNNKEVIQFDSSLLKYNSNDTEVPILEVEKPNYQLLNNVKECNTLSDIETFHTMDTLNNYFNHDITIPKPSLLSVEVDLTETASIEDEELDQNTQLELNEIEEIKLNNEGLLKDIISAENSWTIDNIQNKPKAGTKHSLQKLVKFDYSLINGEEDDSDFLDKERETGENLWRLEGALDQNTILEHDMNDYEFFKPGHSFDVLSSINERDTYSLDMIGMQTDAGEAFSEDPKSLNESLISTQTDGSEFHMWSSNIAFGDPEDVLAPYDIDFDSILSATNLDEALKKLEIRIQDKGEVHQWLNPRTPSPSLQSLEKYFIEGSASFDLDEFYERETGGLVAENDYAKEKNFDSEPEYILWASTCEKPNECIYANTSIENEDISDESHCDESQHWIISPFQYPRVLLENAGQMSIIDEEEDHKTDSLSATTKQLEDLPHIPESSFKDKSTQFHKLHSTIGKDSCETSHALEESNHVTTRYSVVENNASLFEDSYQLPLEIILSSDKGEPAIPNFCNISKHNQPIVPNKNLCRLTENNDSSLCHGKEEYINQQTIPNKQGPLFFKDSITYESKTLSIENIGNEETKTYMGNVNDNEHKKGPKGNNIRAEIKDLLQSNFDFISEKMLDEFTVCERKAYWDKKLMKMQEIAKENTQSTAPKSLLNIKSGTVLELVSCFINPGEEVSAATACMPKQIFTLKKTSNKCANKDLFEDNKESALTEEYLKKTDEKMVQPQSIESTITDTASMKLVSHWKSYWDDIINDQQENNKVPSKVNKPTSISEDDESCFDINTNNYNREKDLCHREKLCNIISNEKECSQVPEKTHADNENKDIHHESSVMRNIKLFSNTDVHCPSPKEYLKKRNILTNTKRNSLLLSYSSISTKEINVTEKNTNKDKNENKSRSYGTEVVNSTENFEIEKKNENKIDTSKQTSSVIEKQNDFKIRFERAKQFFKHLEKSGPGDIKGRDFRSMPRLHLHASKTRTSMDSDSGTDIIPHKRRDRYRGKRKKKKDSARVQSAPTSDTETSKRVIHKDSFDSFGGSVKCMRVSERFHVKDLFRDVSGEDGSFKGIPNRAAVLASLRSVDDERAVSPYQMDYTTLKLTSSLGNIPSGFQEEYPYLPTTPIHQFHPRSALEFNLIPRSELLDQQF